MSRLHALLILALHFLRHCAAKVTLVYNRGGAERFLLNYAPDGLHPVSTAARAALPQWHRCTVCGICDAHSDGTSVMMVVGASLRDLSRLPDARAAAIALASQPEGLARAEASCPERVPISAAVAFVASSGLGAASSEPSEHAN